MKKKMYLAVLAMCIALTAAACGTEKKETETKTAEQAAEKGQETEEQTETEKEKEESGETASGTRIVTVKDIKKYLTLGEYKEIELENSVQEITEDDVQVQLEYELQNYMEEPSGTDAQAQNGDLVTINFVGTMDGEEFEGGTANNYDLILGAGGMIDGFEDGIVGMKKGTTKDVEVVFPENYIEEDLAGKPAVFKITMQKIRRAPELTDEWVAENTDLETVEEYKKMIRINLEENARLASESYMKGTAWNTLVQSSEIREYPEEDIENAVSEYIRQMEVYAEQSGMELETFLETQEMTMEEIEEQAHMYAEDKVKQNLIAQAVMDAEGITLADEECLAIQEELVQAYMAESLEGLIENYGQTAVNEATALLRVEDVLLQYAVINNTIVNAETVGVDAEGGAVVSEEELEELEEEDQTVEIGADAEEKEIEKE